MLQRLCLLILICPCCDIKKHPDLFTVPSLLWQQTISDIVRNINAQNLDISPLKTFVFLLFCIRFSKKLAIRKFHQMSNYLTSISLKLHGFRKYLDTSESEYFVKPLYDISVTFHSRLKCTISPVALYSHQAVLLMSQNSPFFVSVTLIPTTVVVLLFSFRSPPNVNHYGTAFRAFSF